MTRRPFDPGELDRMAADADRAAAELERYVAITASETAPRLVDRVMAAVDRELLPRRGILAWLLAPSTVGGAWGGLLRTGVLAATLVLAVVAALSAAQLADLMRNVGGDASLTPAISPSALPAVSNSPFPSLTVEPSPSPAPASSDDPRTPAPQPTVVPTAHETPEGSGEDSREEETPTPTPSGTPSP